ncbi:MAG: aroK [Acidimicrobiales bacterium]|nr:aroK [Acidimicrobiales bacterium]
MIPVVLVGLMGTGKSTVGALVAARTGRTLVDADRAIEARTGKTVRELWEAGGEAAYRQLESAVVLDAIAGDEPTVIAAPAGAVLDPAVRAALDDAFVVWLRADPATLAARVGHGDHRPLLGDHPKDVLAAMAKERAHLYQGVADAVVDVDALDAEAAATAVLDLLPGDVRDA